MFIAIVCTIFVSGCIFNHAESTHLILSREPSYITNNFNFASALTKYRAQESTVPTPREHRIGSVQDIDSVISHFLNFTHYLRYFKSNFYHIKNTWLQGYPEYESYHYIVQAMIYAHIECVISWEEANSLFMMFGNLRPILEWKIDLVSIVNNTFNPCKWNGVECDTLSTSTPEQMYPHSYVSHLDIQIPIYHQYTTTTSKQFVSIYLNYSLPRHLRTLSLRNVIIYHFRLWSMPRQLEELVIVSCQFAQNGDFSFEWNSIPSQLTTLRILQSITPPKFWTSQLQKNFSSIKIDNSNETLFMPSWLKPKLEIFNIRDCPTFENDATSLIMHQFINKIYIMAPNLGVLALEKLKLHGVVFISDFLSNIEHAHVDDDNAPAFVSFVESGMDIIGISMYANMERIIVRSYMQQWQQSQNTLVGALQFDTTKAETEYNEYRSLERHLNNQHLAQKYANVSEMPLSNQDIEYIWTKLKIHDTLNKHIHGDTNQNATVGITIGIQHWVENPAAFVSAKQCDCQPDVKRCVDPTKIGLGLIVTAITISILVVTLHVITK